MVTQKFLDMSRELEKVIEAAEARKEQAKSSSSNDPVTDIND